MSNSYEIKFTKERIRQLEQIKGRRPKKLILTPRFVFEDDSPNNTINSFTDFGASDIFSPDEFADAISAKLNSRLSQLQGGNE